MTHTSYTLKTVLKRAFETTGTWNESLLVFERCSYIIKIYIFATMEKASQRSQSGEPSKVLLRTDLDVITCDNSRACIKL